MTLCIFGSGEKESSCQVSELDYGVVGLLKILFYQSLTKVSSSYIKSYIRCIESYCTVVYLILSNFCVWYHIVVYHIILQCSVSYPIIFYCNVSHCMVSYRIVVYRIVS